MITALIITLNEENIISKCLSRLSFVDEIIIFDSFSSDDTINIAKSYGARVVKRRFDNFASQRQAALSSVKENCDWVLMLDADEILTDDLKKEIITVTSLEQSDSMYMVRRKDIFLEKWIKRSSGYPTWFPRLFKNGSVQVRREINEEYITKGKKGYLKNHLVHYPFNKGLSWWFHKHVKYAEMEAIKMNEERKVKVNFLSIFSRDPQVRRKFQKRLSYFFPFRPTIIFFLLYIVRGGFLDGKAGYYFCLLRKTYEGMIAVNYKNIQRKNK